jgi:hypothetical protein
MYFILRTSDGQIFILTKELVQYSPVLNIKQSNSTELLNIDSDTFNRVSEYLKLEEENKNNQTTNWKNKFVEDNQKHIFTIYNASICLQIKNLFKILCEEINCMMRLVSSDEEKTLNIILS